MYSMIAAAVRRAAAARAAAAEFVIATKMFCDVTTAPYDQFRRDKNAPLIPTRAPHDTVAQKMP
jgi:hypothetical protein|eukprot:1053735-Prymnesium_polylepis.1